MDEKAARNDRPAGGQPDTGGGSDRRDFLKQMAVAAAAGPGAAAPLAAGRGAESRAGESEAGGRSAERRVEFPRVFRGEALRTIAFPLGGIGTGSISLGGRGQLRDWEIFNRPDKGYSPNYAFPAIWARQAGGKPVARVLEARILPPYEGRDGLGAYNVPGLPRLEEAVFTGEFPFARVAFADPKLPVSVELEAWSPFIPLDEDASGHPVAVLDYRVHNPGREAVDVSLAYSIDNPVGQASRRGAPGRRNTYREAGPLEGLFMDNPFTDAKDPLKGTFALCAVGWRGESTHLTGWRGGSRWRVGPLAFWDDFSEDGRLDPARHPIPQPVGSLCLSRTLEPGEDAHFVFLLAWHFPNRTPQRCGWRNPWSGEEQPPWEEMLIGNHYCRQFADAWAAAESAAGRLEELEKGTRDFVETMKSTSLPPAVIDAALSNLSTLRTNTCFRTADGEFHAFEGCNDQSGCCFGSCTHVWNYESMLAFLFPKLSRSLRERQFGWLVDERGLQEFRYYLPLGRKRWGRAAADGQMGTLMKLYLDWKLSGDTGWLRKLWPQAKRAIEFAWIENGWDADRDGVMEGCQHNTYDIEFFGPNPLSGIWYLGGLRAAEEMARAVGDQASADEYRRLFENGRHWIDENLFNGEFYIQKVQGRPREKIAEGLMVGMGTADPEHPDFQMGEGCLADQVLGQYFARVAGLGDLVDPDHARKALESIFKYNFKADLSEHESVQRTYALNDDAGLVICDYAGRKRPVNPFPYFAEVWTGIEYQVAAHMFFEGMAAEGERLFEAARLRHDGVRRNPWNEPECGHHYARALAAWSGVLGACGFDYSAPEQALALSPRLQANPFAGFWSVPSGWGRFEVARDGSRARLKIETRRGALACRRIRLAPGRYSSAQARAGQASIPAEAAADGEGTAVTLGSTVRITPAASLELQLS